MNSNLNARKNEINLLTDAELDSVVSGKMTLVVGAPAGAMKASMYTGGFCLTVWATPSDHGFAFTAPH